MSIDPHGFKPLNCLRCQQSMSYLGRVPLRSGGSSGVSNFWLGQLGELDEKVFELDVYRCPDCKRLEFFDFDESLPIR